MPYSADLTALKHCYLCVFVMWDRRNEASYFQPYYRILPTTYENMPIFWDADELAHLEGSFMLRHLEDRKANIKAYYDEICKHAPEFRQYSLDEIKWAQMMDASRNFGITVGRPVESWLGKALVINGWYRWRAFHQSTN